MAFNAVAPFLVYLAIGYCVIRFRWVERTFMDKLNNLVFRVFFPFLMFNNVYGASPSDMPSLKLVLIGVLGLFVLLWLLFLIVPRLVPENSRRGVVIQSLFRSNFIIFGMSLTTFVFGAEKASIVGVMVLIMISLFNIASVVVLQIYSGEGRVKPGPLLLSLIKNPLLQGCILGLCFFIFHWKLPGFAATAVSSLASVATPLAMITLGAALQFDEIKKNSRTIVAVLSVRLILLPLVMLFISWCIGLRGIELFMILMIFGTPIATSSYPMAQNMGGDGQLAGHLLFVSTIASIFTIFLFILFMYYLGFIPE